MSRQDPTLPGGSVVGGRFRVECLLGRGGMAEVYGTTDLASGRRVAVKLLKRDVAGREEAVERLKREARVLQSLDHPGIVRLETFGALEDGRIFIAMEWLEGETLGSRLRRVGSLGAAELTPIVCGVCDALEAAHRTGVVHRDLKPDNVFLLNSEERPVKVLDFGVSKVTGSDQLTATGEVLGTPRYMAPEQLAAERDLDGRTDVYALGIVLYEALAGRPPFLASVPTELIVAILHGKAAPIRSYCPNLAEGVAAVVTRAMARARAARFPSAVAMSQAWLDAAPAAPPMEVVRPGISTVALGSMSRADLPEAPRLAETPVVRPGTFRQFAQAGTLPAISAPQGLAAPGAASGALPQGGAPQALAVPVVAQPPPTDRHVASPAPKGYPSGSYALPTHSGRVLLIAVGLFAGVLSAAAAVWALRTFWKSPTREDTSGFDVPAESTRSTMPPLDGPGAAPPPVGAAVPPVEPRSGSGETPVAELPAGMSEQTSSSQAPRPEPARSRRRRSSTRRRRSVAKAQSPIPMTEARDERSVREVLRDARTALREGNTGACLEQVGIALAKNGGSSALRLQGDCFLRAGNRAAALRSYERFCRLAGDHPAIGEVRGLVESMGGHCR